MYDDYFLITRYYNTRGNAVYRLYGAYASKSIAQDVIRELTSNLTPEDLTRSEFEIITATYPPRKRRR